MLAGVDTSPGRPPASGASRCMGCASWMERDHDCGGDKIPAQGMGWHCDCPQDECRRRQQGTWPAKPAATKRART